MATPLDHLLKAGAIVVITNASDHGRRTRIQIEPVLIPVDLMDGQIIGTQREGGHLTPLRTQKRRDALGKRIAALIDEKIERQRLPAVGVREQGVGREGWKQRWVDGLVEAVRIVVFLIRAVTGSESKYGSGDTVTQCRRRITRRVCKADVIAKLGHLCIKRGQRLRRTGRVHKTGLEDAIGGVADGLVPGGDDVLSAGLLLMEIVAGHRIVGCPGIPHGDRGVEEIARVHGGTGIVVADGLQQLLVPVSRGRVLRRPG